jgi:Uma2 family endonuclease
MKTPLMKREARRSKGNGGLPNGRLGMAHAGTGRLGEPAWQVATLFPEQGDWSDEDYLALPGNHLVELSDGVLEVLPMPTTSHQLIVVFLWQALQTFAGPLDLGLPLLAAVRVRLWARKFREPDVVFMLKEHEDRVGEEFWEGADLVMEVVSGDPKDRHRDLVTKRDEYARARIPEYWIVDPKLGQITVLWLKGKKYRVHGVFKEGEVATSRLLPGFEVAVSEAFAGPSA